MERNASDAGDLAGGSRAGSPRRRASKSGSAVSLIYSEDAAEDDSILPTDIIAAAESASEADIARTLYETESDKYL
jgi:hypothetical protein